jgi:hypothetical protein
METAKTALWLLLFLIVYAYIGLDGDDSMEQKGAPQNSQSLQVASGYADGYDSEDSDIDSHESFEGDDSGQDEGELASSGYDNKVDELIMSSKEPQSKVYSSLETDFGNDITARLRVRDCPLSSYREQGYPYLFFIDIPLSRVKNDNEVFNVKGNRAITVLGCWVKKDGGNVSVKMKRKKDGKVWLHDYDTSKSDWDLVTRVTSEE